MATVKKVVEIQNLMVALEIITVDVEAVVEVAVEDAVVDFNSP